MVDLTTTHDTKWLSPHPMWNDKAAKGAGSSNPAFMQPAILRFNSDLFMDELLALMAYRPCCLGQWVAQPETWRQPMVTPAIASELNVVDPVSNRSQQIARQTLAGSAPSTATIAAEASLPLKLYQPAQQRYYLVTASLVCRKRGLPDRVVNPGNQECTGFVIRRLNCDDAKQPGPWTPDGIKNHEYAYVKTADGYAWKKLKLDERDTLQKEEERLPMFNVHYNSQPHKRRLLAGLIPVGKREAYIGAAKSDSDGTADTPETETASTDPRRLLFEAQVIAPWKALVEQADTVELQLKATSDATPDGEEEENALEKNYDDQLKNTREQIQTGSWYVLLDFTLFLKKHLEIVWQHLKGATLERPLTSAESKLAVAIRSVTISNGSALYNTFNDYAHSDYTVKTSLVGALISILNQETQLESVETAFDSQVSPSDADNLWPSFLFPLANPGIKRQGTNLPEHDEALNVPVPVTDASVSGLEGVDKKLAHLDELANLVEASLEETQEPLAELEAPNTVWDNRDAWFVIRCVYERPNCGPMNPPVVSQATVPFQMAPFFDPDAPARPIRIPMPVDISPAGLRKFKKNTTFMISDMLCGKIKGIRKMTLGDLVLSVLPWPFHKSLPDVGSTGPCKDGKGFDIGMFCSLSIPIVTLCALILLMIIVQLFDIFFRWIPYLFICFPIPGLKGKKD